MKNKKTAFIAVVILVFFPIAGGIGANLAISKLGFVEPEPQIEPLTRFYAVNESEIIAGKPVVYMVTIENQEGKTVEYDLKVQLEGKEIHNQKIIMANGNVSEQAISFTPILTGDYQKLEFILFKGNVSYRNMVLQILPVIDYSQVHAITPPFLQNGNMENSTGWNFSGKKFSGSYTAAEYRSGRRSYQVKTASGVTTGAFGSIIQEFPGNEVGFASLSFEVKSDNASYYLQSVVNDNVVWENSSGKNWTRIKVPVFLKKSNKLELKVIANNDTKSNITVWWDNVGLENYSSIVNIAPVEKIPIVNKVDPVIVYNYTVVKNESSIVYTFESQEKLELFVLDGKVNEGNAVYTASSTGDRIVFMGDLYEKVLPNRVNHLYPVILDITNKKLTINDTLKLKNNYSIILEQINNNRVFIGVSKIYFNRYQYGTMDGFFINENSFVEYREEGSQIFQRGTETYNFFEYGKKYKKIKIYTTFINQTDAIFNITQYGSKKIISPGDTYGEFQIVNITGDSIVMKNILPINLTNVTAGKQLSLMKGKIKIKV